eukprot:CAMPEP_0173396926 /NCGR_PEP_ID=MMETSP1356-20130122/36910_1 /TAXON_ID=77927 ORGANISM="Hemiselmis virescens, Strain PCC157" /NCGR_SAMPLE_ID=MMETSP1356 /ASSEMBLY_ACC=CAM_ASM_000847 /LENGTH=39 /DNA_ID= /DNA_START= /DNA_END= /DNA_ORIENTATION=
MANRQNLAFATPSSFRLSPPPLATSPPSACRTLAPHRPA